MNNGNSSAYDDARKSNCAALLSIVFSVLYTSGGILCHIDAGFTCLVTMALFIINFVEYTTSMEQMASYKLANKVYGAACSAVIALITFTPAVYFLLAEVREYVYVNGYVAAIEYDIPMLILSGIAAVIGIISVMMPICCLFEIRRKCRIWGKSVK